MELTLLILLFVWQMLPAVFAHQFISHVYVTTPAHSYSHGVGDLVSIQRRHVTPIRNLRLPQMTQAQLGYSRQRPSIPFHVEETPRMLPWQQDMRYAEKIPLLPPSPYKVDSADPESLWPEGLFIPPPPLQFDIQRRSSQIKNSRPSRDDDFLDPYLLQGSEAILAIEKTKQHGELYFHDVPHIQSLLTNQQHRVENNLKPHRLGSIRHTWPFNRT
ncbi:uncharacterized protein LOC123712041 isoform X1 [Pieris brassicae]|uniref:uncharacterized protein LOC123712041 isoform X1 n=1 Tax=Pieris brassicae TaxID=7116 RepID=UPI001E66242E|nr:uncharacterized protein LOC123712041 isoform X1 [Pieris brassicae]